MISAVLHRLGYHTPRGSSGRNKGGHLGLKTFVDYVNRGNPGGIAVDAPLGPPHVVKRGIVLAAAKTGAPLLPQVWYARPNVAPKESGYRKGIPDSMFPRTGTLGAKTASPFPSKR